MTRQEIVFIVVIVLINLAQAATTGLSGDEALYWMYSRNLDFAFKDHPPMIGLFTGFGYTILKNELGVRLAVVLANAITMWCIFKLFPMRTNPWFLLIPASIPILHVYGFIATPDVPLLLFTAIYLLLWKKFLERQTVERALYLGVCMAALVWSKYHGLFVILFLLLPLRSFWFHKRFWLASLIGIILFSPHIIWQAIHDLPSLKFHLVQRSGEFHLSHVWNYLGGQLLVFNPVIPVLFVYAVIKMKSDDRFHKSIRWLAFGMLLIFLLSSTRGRVEPHWTAVAAIPMLIVLASFYTVRKIHIGIKLSLIFFIGVLVFARVNLVTGIFPKAAREFLFNEKRMNEIHSIAGNLPVSFMNSYQDPSLYMFYTGVDAHSLNNIDGGKNQYDYWDYNEVVNKKPMIFVSNGNLPGADCDTLFNGRQVYSRRFDDLPVAHRLTLRTDKWLVESKPGERVEVTASLTNGNSYEMDFSDSTHVFIWQGIFANKKENEQNFDIQLIPAPGKLKAGESMRVVCSFIAPNDVGTIKGGFALGIDHLPMTYQSNWIRLVLSE